MNSSLPATGVLGIGTVLASIAPIHDDFAVQSPSRILSGLPPLDRLTHGFRAGDLIVLAAKRGVGKTSLATTIAQNASVGHRIPSLLAFFDTTFEDYGQRFLAAQAHVDINRILDGNITALEVALLEAAHGTLRQAPISFFSGQDTTIGELRDKISGWCNEHERRPALVVVDTLQFIRASGYTSPDQQAKQALEELKLIAQENLLVIVATSQVHPSTSSPELAVQDLVYADAVAAFADVIVLLAGDSDLKRLSVITKHSSGAPSLELLFKSEWAAFLTAPPAVSQ